MEFIDTQLEGVFLIKPRVFQDQRGFFLESYSQKEFGKKGIKANFVQDNFSFSRKKGTLRGLHFQLPPFSQAKLVRVSRGKVWDVVVDLRKNSPTFGQWQGFELSQENFLMLFVPCGFAHGFCTLEDEVDFCYKVDNFYDAQSDSGIVWNDPDLAIDWPLENQPIISEKDENLPQWKDFLQSNPF